MAAVIVAAACDSGSTGPSSPIGEYALVSVDGDAVPSVLAQSPNYLLELTEGALALAPAGTFAAQLTVRQTVDAVSELYYEETVGGWQAGTGNTILFTSPTFTVPDTATWDGTRLTLRERSSRTLVVSVWARR